MTLFPFNTGIPASGNNPSVDQPGMLQNNVSTNGIIAVDHNTFNVNQGGYHTDIHMIPQSVPGSIASIGQLFAQTVTINAVTDTQLFFETGTGVLNQLTGSKTGFNGYAYVGNIILQWGFVNTSFPSTGSVVYTGSGGIAFPTKTIFVLTTPYYDAEDAVPTSRAIVGIDADVDGVSPPKTGFNWNALSDGSGWTGFYWFAIGN